MAKVVINSDYGGFGISREAVEWLRENGYEAGEKCVLPGEMYSDGSGPAREWKESFGGRQMNRDDPGLLAVIEELGEEKASAPLASLKVVEVPDGVEWTIEEYDGAEWVAERHKTWS